MTGKILVAFLVVVGLGMIVLAVAVRPIKFPPDTEADRLAAEAALFGFGALLLAFVGTVVAIVAYVNSTEEPSLTVSALMGLGLRATHPLRVAPAPIDSPFNMGIQLTNNGSAAARFVAVRVTWDGVEMGGGVLAPWRLTETGKEQSQAFVWEGGADAVVHPGWDYGVPWLHVRTVRVSDHSQDTALTIEVVADAMSPVVERLQLHVT